MRYPLNSVIMVKYLETTQEKFPPSTDVINKIGRVIDDKLAELNAGSAGK